VPVVGAVFSSAYYYYYYYYRPLDAGVVAAIAAMSELSQCHSEPFSEHVNRCVG